MEPRIVTIKPKKLTGKRLRMSLAGNRTFELWSSFMPLRKSIPNITGNDLYSLQVYDESYFKNFDPGKEFEKWAAVEVSGHESIPGGMEAFDLPGGMYAVFIHKGPASEAARTFGYIFQSWLPQSGYMIDNRPHFEVMGENYRRDDPAAEEEVYIPVVPKP